MLKNASHSVELASRVTFHPVLIGLDESALEFLSGRAIPVIFEKDEVILHQGGQANRLYLIEEGEIALEAQNGGKPPFVLETVGAGDLLGWSWMFPPYMWNFT